MHCISLKYCFFLLILSLFPAALQPGPAEAAAGPDNQALLRERLNLVLENDPTGSLGFVSLHTEPAAVDRNLVDLYRLNGGQPYWVTEQGPGRKAEALLSVLQTADEDGLDPDQYRLPDIQSVWSSRGTADLARLDVMLTLAMGAYVTDMREGRAVSCLLDPKLFAAARDQNVNIIEVIRQGLSAPDLVLFLQQQAPQHFAYQLLKTGLARYRKLADQGGWPEIPAGKTLKPGMQDDRIGLLIKRLSITGDLAVPVPPTDIYSEQLVEAVQHFQYRYNLEQDGIIGRATLTALNIPIRDHINKIILNMERWRWLPHTLEGNRLLVNIAGFRLVVIEDEQPALSMPVIVGKVYHKTPVFSRDMRYIEINPFWNIPNSIAKNEIVPKMVNDQGYLQKERIRIFAGWQDDAREIDPASIDWRHIGKGITRYRLRQDPGPDNALGTIKFMFPNSYNIYLHDTPAHNLFKRNHRSFSHGCIRVSRPRELALYILSNDAPGWTPERIDDLIKTGKRTVIPLKNPLPVHILYRTAFVDPRDETIHFYDDVYGRDSLLAEALFTGKQAVQCKYSYR